MYLQAMSPAFLVPGTYVRLSASLYLLTQHGRPHPTDPGGHLPQPLLLPVALRRLFQHNEPVRHIMGDAGHAWFVSLHAGGWVLSHFLSVHFKAKFCQVGARSTKVSAAAHGSMLPVPAQCAWLPHHGRCRAHPTNTQPIKKYREGRSPGLRWPLFSNLTQHPTKKQCLRWGRVEKRCNWGRMCGGRRFSSHVCCQIRWQKIRN
jgi:hypothetical protein